MNTGQSKRLLVFVVITLTLVIICAGTLIRSGYDDAIKDAKRDVDYLNLILTRHTELRLHESVAIIDMVARSIAQYDPYSLPTEAWLHRMMRDATAGYESIDRIIFIDADGIEIASSRTLPTARIAVADRSYFMGPYHSSSIDDVRSVHVSEPIIDHADGSSFFVLSRRVEPSHPGTTDGVVAAVLRPSQFFHSPQTTIPFKENRSAIIRSDGIALYHNTIVDGNNGLISLSFWDSAPFSDNSLREALVTHATSMRDGVDRFIVRRTISQLPIVVVTACDVFDALAIWRRYSFLVGGSAGAVLLLIFSMLLITNHHAQQQEKTAAALHRVESHIRIIFDNAPIGISIVNRDGIIYMANRCFSDMFMLASERITGMSTRTLYLSNERYEDFHRRSRPIIRNGRIFEEECIMRRLDGREFWCRLVGSLVDPQDTGQGTIWLLSDVSQRRNLEQARRERQELFEQMFVSGPAVKLLIDPNDGRIVDANPAAAQFYGYSQDELRMLRIWNINTLTEEQIRNEMEEAKRDQRQYFLFSHRLASGEMRDVEVYSGPISVSGRSLLFSIIHDITDRRRTEERLHLYKAVIDHARDPILCFEPRHGFQHVQVNVAATRHFGISEQKLMGMTPLDFDQNLTYESYHNFIPVLERERALLFETLHNCGSRGIIPVEMHVSQMDYIGHTYWIANVRDITERKRTENVMELVNWLQKEFISDKNTHDLFESMLDRLINITQSEYGFMAEIHYNGQNNPYIKIFSFINTTWETEEQKRYSQKIAENSEYSDLNSWHGAVLTTGAPVITNEPAHDPRCYGLPEGHPPLNAFLGLPLSAGNQLVGMIGLANRTDGYDKSIIRGLQPLITSCGVIIMAHRYEQQRRASEQALREAQSCLENQTAELLRSNQDLASFAHVISHDLRQPLRMINGYIALIERRIASNLDDELRKYLYFTHDGVAKLDMMIVGLLNYSRIGHKQSDISNVSLREVIATVRQNLQFSLREYGGIIDVMTPLPEIRGTSIEITQLLQNLLGNAIKYRHPDRPPQIQIAATHVAMAGHWMIRVSDNGIGIPEKDQERVFGIFQRAHSDERYEGTGIGLAICRKIVSQFGGKITLATNPETGGCILSILFPDACVIPPVTAATATPSSLSDHDLPTPVLSAPHIAPENTDHP